jgi:LacI family transcriptional regulator
MTHLKKADINSVEIARLAGVSRSTVSRVINKYSNVPAETRDKVMKVIQQYNYFPNVSAQVLAGKRTRTIGLFLIEPGGQVSSDFLTNMLIVSVIENASAHGYYVLTHIIRNPQDSETMMNVKEIFFQRRIEGGIFIGAANHEPLIEELIGEGFKVGIVDQDLPGRTEPNRIVANFDNENGMLLAVNYLVSLGHKHIGAINGDMKRQSGPSKYQGYLNAMAANHLDVNMDWVMPGDFHESSGYQAIHTLLKNAAKLPTAIIAANDSVAFGAIRALKENGLRVPEDISIIGFDDHALSRMHHPALTTIKVDFVVMLRHLTITLIEKIENGPGEFEPYMLGSSLIIRESCKAI